MTEGLGSAILGHHSGERLQELETENARLKTLVGELLVTNQLLRERVAQVAATASSNLRS